MNKYSKLYFLILSFFLSHCGEESTSETKITNGALAGDKFPFAVFTGNCTGSFLSGNTLLTAAHCVSNGVRYRGYRASKVFVHKGYQGGRNSRYDLAVAVFDRNLAPATVRLHLTRPALKSAITIVGYGCTNVYSKTGGGRKRYGVNTLDSYSNGMLQFYGYAGDTRSQRGRTVGACQGDSGGPLLYKGKQAGVASYISVGRGSQGSTSYVNINHPENIKFLKRTIQRGAKIPDLQNSRPPAEDDALEKAKQHLAGVLTGVNGKLANCNLRLVGSIETGTAGDYSYKLTNGPETVSFGSNYESRSVPQSTRALLGLIPDQRFQACRKST